MIVMNCLLLNCKLIKLFLYVMMVKYGNELFIVEL